MQHWASNHIINPADPQRFKYIAASAKLDILRPQQPLTLQKLARRRHYGPSLRVGTAATHAEEQGTNNLTRAMSAAMDFVVFSGAR